MHPAELRTGEYGEYWGNDYNSSSSLALFQMQVNAKYIRDSLIAKGWTLNAICGMLGNMQIESSINPGRWEGDIIGGDPAGHGYGLVQWTPYSKYTNWANYLGYDPSTMDSNLARIEYEVSNNIQWIQTTAYPYSFSEFKYSTESPEYLGMMFLANYERPANPDQPIRGERALWWYNYLSGIPYVPTTSKKHHFNWLLFDKNIKKRNNCHY